MATPDIAADWWEAEQQYTDEVVGTDPLPQMFEDAVKRYGDGEAQLYKGGVYDRSLTETGGLPEPEAGEYASITYNEMSEIVRRLAAGFRELGLEKGDRVGMFADTRAEWALSDWSVLSAGGVTTTVYTESSPKQVKYLLNNPGAIGVVVENEYLLDRIIKVEDDLSLEFVVVMDTLEKYDDVDQIHSLGDLYELGDEAFDEDEFQSWLAEQDSDDLASLIYTSGTTGQPKGVKLTHANFRANVNQIRKRSGPRPDKSDDLAVVDEDSTTISFLPLAHVFERTVGHFYMFASGATVGYAESADTVGEDMKKIRPSGGASVPRVYERIFDQMREQASESPTKERIFNWATDVGRQYAQTDSPGLMLRLKRGIADQLVFSQVKEQLGGEVKYLVSGGGSLSKDLAQLFEGMGIPIYEGYGLTEASPVVTSNPPEDSRAGTLGPLVQNMEYEIHEEAVSEDRREEADGTIGELRIRGPNVTEGYWELPEETEEAFDEDGYFKTGDIVEVVEDEYLVYHDRLKNLLVLDTCKNVAPDPIEDKFSTSNRVEQIMVMGDDEKFISALIVPNFKAIERWAENRNIDLPDTNAEICQDDRVREWVDEDVQLVNRELEKVEQIKQFQLVPIEWTPENDMLTPSLKKKRRNILEECEEAYDRIYNPTEEEAAAADD